MRAFGLSRSSPDEDDQAREKLPRFDGCPGQFEKMIAVAGDNDSLLALGKFKKLRIRRGRRQNFTQLLNVVVPVSKQMRNLAGHVMIQQKLHKVSLICSATRASISVR